MNIKLITVTWSHQEHFEIEKTSLYRSFKKFNPNIELIHFHFNRNEYIKEELNFNEKFGQESEYLLYKIQLLFDKIKNVDCEYIIFCDANDVTCLSNINYLTTIFDLEKYIIVGHEKNQWPPVDRKSIWPDYQDYNGYDSLNKTYLNSGMILARKEMYVNMLENMINNVMSKDIKNFSNDQGVFTYYYNNNYSPEIKLDYGNIFAVNTFARNTNEFYLDKENKLVSKQTGIKPCFLHDNGWNHGSPKYHNFFELKRLYSNSYGHLKDMYNRGTQPQSVYDYLQKIRDEFGFSPTVVYDVGAEVMGWTKVAQKIWPNAEYYLFEAMEESEEIFQETKNKYHIGVFSDVDNKEITFYKNLTYPGGNSYYMENQKHSGMANALFGNPNNQFKRKTVTLDTIKKQRNFKYPDLLKIDVQGCEIDILRGASDVLKNVKHLIVELQHVEYNIGAMLCDESIPIIESLGFELVTPKFSSCSHADADYHFKRKEL
jgi:FkbM family methyltransferase